MMVRDRGITHLVHRRHGGVSAGHLAVLARPPACDVLHHHDGVVDQDADGENQGEETDPIDRVAHGPEREERQQDRGRDHHADHERFAHAYEQPDQNHDHRSRREKLQEQRAGLGGGGLAVIPDDQGVHIIRDQIPARVLEDLSGLTGDLHPVRAGTLCDGQ